LAFIEISNPGIFWWENLEIKYYSANIWRCCLLYYNCSKMATPLLIEKKVPAIIFAG
jgi:hypothetical protein